MKKINPVMHRIKPTFFEATTAMAFSYFNKKNIDVAVIEAGLGGRLDSTNVVVPSLTYINHLSNLQLGLLNIQDHLSY